MTVADAANPTPEDQACGPGSRTALVVLVALVVLSPWAFGSVDPWATRTITLVSLAMALAAFVWDASKGRPHSSSIPLWPLAGLWLLGVLQLLPIPAALHKLIAPGSAAVWYPDVPTAAAVLGPGPHPISVYPEPTRRTLALGTGLIALALLAAPSLRSRRVMLGTAGIVVSGGVAVALFGLVARLAFGDKLYGIWSVPTIAPFGPFVSKNHFAGYVELAALLSAGLASGLTGEARRGKTALSWIESSRARFIVLAWGVAAALVLAVPVSLSRGGVVALAAGLLAFLFLRMWPREGRPASPRGLLAAGVLASSLLVAVAYVLPGEARERVQTLTEAAADPSGSYRLVVWRDTLRLAESSLWLGSGFGAFEDALRRFKTGAGLLAVQHAENDLLELVAEGGLVGTFFAGVLVALVLAQGARAATGGGKPLRRGLACGAVSGLVALVVHSGFDFNLRIPSNALLCAVLVAFCVATPTGRKSQTPWRLAPIALGATLVVALATSWSSSHVGAGALGRAARSGESSFRRTALARDVAAQLQRRPADAASWLAFAWLRLPASPGEAAALAEWAVQLDPTNRAVRDESSRLTRAGH